MLNAKIAPALKKIITNPYFKKRVNLEEQEAQMEDLIEVYPHLEDTRGPGRD